MNVAVLLVTHNKIATSIVDVVASIINHQPDNLGSVEIPMDDPIESIETKISNELARLSKTDGILILTDIYGSTPSNIAKKFAEDNNATLVSGLNVPMLIRIMNYRTLSLDELTETAIEGGQDGIATYKQGII